MKELIIYMDIFGTKFNFYTDKKNKFYSFLGGLLTITSFFICAIAFYILKKSDFQREKPFTIISSYMNKKITNYKLDENNIWIPWRIIYNDINEEKRIFFNITYNIKNISYSNDYIKSKQISYKLCNETSMVNLSDNYNIDMPLNKYYCVNSKEIEMSPSSDNSIPYLKIDFFLDDDREDDEEKIEDKSIAIEYLFPEISVELTNLEKPVSIIYRHNYYYIRKNTYKNIVILFSKNIFSDDLGWFKTSIIEYYYWTADKTDIDTYFIPNSSISKKVYTIKFFLDSNIIIYNRYFKKFYSIFIEGLPLIYILFVCFKKIAKILKSAQENKKLIELLFENLIVKKNKIREYLLNKTRKKNINKEGRNNIIINNKDNPYNISNDEKKINIIKKSQNIYNSNVNQHKKDIYASEIKSFVSKNNNHYSLINKSPFKLLGVNSNNLSSLSNLRKSKKIMPFSKVKKFSDHIKQYLPAKLFSYRYYLYLIFMKNLNITKRNYCFPKKFVKTNLFLSQLLDISSYIFLQREFQVLKNHILSRKDINFIEKGKKININSQEFNKNLNECLEKQKFNILAHINKK